MKMIFLDVWKVLEKWVFPVLGESAVSPHYKTPPYLTARPEITKCTLVPKDKFVVIASDGLWDLLSPTQVIRLVIQADFNPIICHLLVIAL